MCRSSARACTAKSIFKAPDRRRFAFHGTRWWRGTDKHSNRSLLTFHSAVKVTDHRNRDIATAFDGDQRLVRPLTVGLEVDDVINPAVSALFLTAEGVRVDN